MNEHFPANASGAQKLMSHLSPLKMKMLAASLGLGAVGVGLKATSAVSPAPTPPPPAQTTTVTPPPSSTPPAATPSNSHPAPQFRPGSGFVSGSPTFPSAPAPATPEPSANPSPTEISPSSTAPPQTATDATRSLSDISGTVMSKLGISFFVGIVVGMFFRVFLKTMAALSAAVVALFVLLNHFHVVNIDPNSAQSDFNSVTAWISGHAWQLKDVLFNVLPSTGSAGVGFVFGFKRK